MGSPTTNPAPASPSNPAEVRLYAIESFNHFSYQFLTALAEKYEGTPYGDAFRSKLRRRWHCGFPLRVGRGGHTFNLACCLNDVENNVLAAAGQPGRTAKWSTNENSGTVKLRVTNSKRKLNETHLRDAIEDFEEVDVA